MATMNPFDLLGDNENDDPTQLIESATAQAQLQKLAPNKKSTPLSAQLVKQAKLPSKPLPPAQSVREAKTETGRGFGRGGGRGRGGYNRDYSNNENSFGNPRVPNTQREEGEGDKQSERRPFGGPCGPYRGGGGGGGGGRRGGFNNEEGRNGERPRRMYDRRSGTGQGNDFKREGSGRGNWGTQSDEVDQGAEKVKEETEKDLNTEDVTKEDAVDGNKEGQLDEPEKKEPEEKVMTLEEYEKVLEEKRKALLALKTEERKVVVDKDFESMQQLSNKKDDESVFIKLGSDKDKKKDAAEKEKAKKLVNIHEFLKSGDGGGGKGRGRGGRGGPRGGYSGGGVRNTDDAPAPAIEDPGQFPTLGALAK